MRSPTAALFVLVLALVSSASSAPVELEAREEVCKLVLLGTVVASIEIDRVDGRVVYRWVSCGQQRRRAWRIASERISDLTVKQDEFASYVVHRLCMHTSIH